MSQLPTHNMSITPQHNNATQPSYNGQYVNGNALNQYNSTPGLSGQTTFDEQSAGNSRATTNGHAVHATQDTKKHARQVMSTINTNINMPSSITNSDIAQDGTQQNGVKQLSRKRSRDGAQLPIEAGQPDKENGTLPNNEANEARLKRYMELDLQHQEIYKQHREKSQALVKAKERERDFYLNEFKYYRSSNSAGVFGYGYAGYGNRTTEGKTQIVYSTLRGAPKGRRLRDIHVPRKDIAQQAEQHEELVPLRIDIEMDKLRLRDTFTWNLNERTISPDVFADYLLEDLKVPLEYLTEVGRQVKTEMHEQILNFYPHVIIEDGPLEPGQPYSDFRDEEMRIQIKLNITIGRITLVDQFEWDINDPQNSPEEFAKQMAWENALSGEFTTAIAHSIREQSQLFTKSLYLTNHCFDGRPIEDTELRDSFLAGPIASAFRPQQMQKDWQPYMYEMSEAELDRTETSMMREHRAQKRQLNRRGGPALPDLKDRQRTVRSLFVHSVIPGAVETFEVTGILKTRRNRSIRRPGARLEGDPDSSDLESDDSGVDSPAPSTHNAGTARTRGMRGAASAAQAAMRANYGRSQTPDLQPGPSELRASRRTTLRDEDNAEEDSLIVRLKIGKARFKQWLDEYRAKKKASEYPLSGYVSQPPVLQTPAAARNVAAANTTPRPARHATEPNGRSAPSAKSAGVEYDSRGAATIDHWPYPNEDPPPPPAWLTEAITVLRSRHPTSNFEPLMRIYCLDTESNQSVKIELQAGDAPPEDCKFQYLPKIRCLDCPAKVYTAVPDRVVEDFEVHLKNRAHREKVEARQQRKKLGGRT